MGRTRPLLLISSATLLLCLAALAVVTSLATVAAYYPYDCRDLRTIDRCPDSQTSIAAFVHRRTSYFQALHSFLLKSVLICCLAVLSAPLTALLWRSLDPRTAQRRQWYARSASARGITLDGLDGLLVLSRAPGLASVLQYIRANRSILAVPVVLVVLFSLLELISDFAVGPIYRTHLGSWNSHTEMSTGAYMTLVPASAYSPDALLPGGVAFGRIKLTSKAVQGQPWVAPDGVAQGGLPFLLDADLNRIADVSITTLPSFAATLDCGPSAAPSQLVSVGPAVWTGGDGFSNDSVTYKRQDLGQIRNAAGLVWLAFGDAAIDNVAPGQFNASALVMVFATNSTIEGAQQTLRPPNASASRISSIDVLYCHSQISFRLSQCRAFNPSPQGAPSGTGASMGSNANTTSITCTPVAAADFSPALKKDAYGGLGQFINIPPNVGQVLAAAPVWALAQVSEFLPSFPTFWSAVANIFPLPFTTIGDGSNDTAVPGLIPPSLQIKPDAAAAITAIPKSYITDTLFPQAQHGLLQGFIVPGPNGNATVSGGLIASFATSNPWLPILYFGLAVLFALIVLLLACISPSVRQVPDLTVARTLGLASQNRAIEPLLGPYRTDAGVYAPEEGTPNARIWYRWDEQTRRKVLEPVDDFQDGEDGSKEFMERSLFGVRRRRGTDATMLSPLHTQAEFPKSSDMET